MGLAPHDEREWDDIVEKPHSEECTPYDGLHGQRHAREAQHEVQHASRDSDPQSDDGERRELLYGDPDKQERATPEHGKQNQQGPVLGPHSGSDGLCHELALRTGEAHRGRSAALDPPAS